MSGGCIIEFFSLPAFFVGQTGRGFYCFLSGVLYLFNTPYSMSGKSSCCLELRLICTRHLSRVMRSPNTTCRSIRDIRRVIVVRFEILDWSRWSRSKAVDANISTGLPFISLTERYHLLNSRSTVRYRFPSSTSGRSPSESIMWGCGLRRIGSS